MPRDVAEVDPSGKQPDGQPLHEAVWVDYFADQGDINSSTALVSDASLGIQTGYDTLWTPPPTPGPAKLWAVVHDSRGGVTPIERTVWVSSGPIPLLCDHRSMRTASLLFVLATAIVPAVLLGACGSNVTGTGGTGGIHRQHGRAVEHDARPTAARRSRAPAPRPA